MTSQESPPDLTASATATPIPEAAERPASIRPPQPEVARFAEVFLDRTPRFGIQARVVLGLPEKKVELLTQQTVEVDQEQCLSYFKGVGAQEYNYRDFLGDIPTGGETPATDRDFDRLLNEWAGKVAGVLNEHDEGKKLVAYLLGREELGEITLDDVKELRQKFAKEGDLIDFYQKAHEMAEKKGLEGTIRWLALALHGKRRVAVLEQMSLLEKIAKGEEAKWEEAAEKIVKEGKELTEDERVLLGFGEIEELEEKVAEEAEEVEAKEDRFGCPKPAKAEHQVSGKDMDRGATYDEFDFVTEDLVKQRGRLLTIADGMSIGGAGSEAERAVNKFQEFYYQEKWQEDIMRQLHHAYDQLVGFFGGSTDTTFSAAVIHEGKVFGISVGNSLITIRDSQGEIVFSTFADAKSVMKEGRRVSETPGIGSEISRLQTFQNRPLPERGCVVLNTDGVVANIAAVLKEGGSLQKMAKKIVSLESEDDQFVIVAQP